MLQSELFKPNFHRFPDFQLFAYFLVKIITFNFLLYLILNLEAFSKKDFEIKDASIVKHRHFLTNSFADLLNSQLFLLFPRKFHHFPREHQPS